jgi:uncharacterized protein with HEPN domain
MELISKDLLYLEDIFNEIVGIEKAIDILSTPLLFDDFYYIANNSILKNITVIGEAFNQLSDAFRKEYPDLPYDEIRGLRNLIVHQYGDVDIDRIKKIAINDIPNLKIQIAKIIEEIL